MIDISKLQIGDKVYYQPIYYKSLGKYENGIVKEIINPFNNFVRVVYNCNDDWDNFKNYTSTLTNIRDLKLGWKYNNTSGYDTEQL